MFRHHSHSAADSQQTTNMSNQDNATCKHCHDIAIFHMNLARMGLGISDTSSGILRFDCDALSPKCTTCLRTGMRCTLQTKGKWHFEFNSVKRKALSLSFPREEIADEDAAAIAERKRLNRETSIWSGITIVNSNESNLSTSDTSVSSNPYANPIRPSQGRRSTAPAAVSCLTDYSNTEDIDEFDAEFEEDTKPEDWKTYFTFPTKAASILDMDNRSSHLARSSTPRPDTLSRRSSGHNSYYNFHSHVSIDSIISGISSIFHGTSVGGSSTSSSQSHSRRTSCTSVHGPSPPISKRSSVAATTSISSIEEDV